MRSPGGLYHQAAGRMPPWAPVLFSCRLFPAALVIHVLNLRVHLDAQLDRGRRKVKGRLSFLIAADKTWAAEGWVWVKEEEGTSKGEMKSLDFALYVFSSMCTLHEGAVARVSESVSETLTPQGQQVVHRFVLTLAKIHGKDFQLCTACLSIWSNDISVLSEGSFYYLWAHHIVKWVQVDGWSF